MIENNDLNHLDEMTHFNCLEVDKVVNFHRVPSVSYDDYPEMARKNGSTLLGRYKIKKLIDYNQFGFTYLVGKINTNEKKFVIKEFFPQKYVKRGNGDVMIIRTSLSVDDLTQFNFMKNFFTGEIENLEKILKNPHPNIMAMDAIVKNQNNTMYIIYAYEKGITLEEYLQDKQGDFKNSEIYSILDPILNAVGHLDTLKIHHFDIKPRNIIMKKDGTLLLLGFEASSVFYDEYDQSFCNGYTPRYAAPEQISVQKISSLNTATDIYAIGILLYRMVTGSFPSKASERLECKLYKDEEDPYVLLQDQALSEKYDLTLLSTIDKALKFSNKERFKNIVKFKNSLYPSSKKKSYLYIPILAVCFIAVVGWSIFDKKKEISKTKIKNVSQLEKQVVTKKEKLKKKVVLNQVSKEEKDGHTKKNIPEKVAIQKSHEDVPKKVLKSIKSLVENVESNTTPAKEGSYKKLLTNNVKIETNQTVSPLNSKQEKNVIAKVSSKKEQKKEKIQAKEEIDVSIDIMLSQKIGKSKILINGKEVSEGHFLAYRGENYKIDVVNPYYYPLHEKRTFVELSEFPEQVFSLELGKAKMYLKGLPSDTTIKVVYQLNETEKKVDVNETVFHNNTYEILLDAGKRFYIIFEKAGYKPLKTEVFMLKHAKAFTKIYKLEKKELPKKVKIEEKILVKAKPKIVKEKKESMIKKKEIKKKKDVEKNKQVVKKAKPKKQKEKRVKKVKHTTEKKRVEKKPIVVKEKKRDKKVSDKKNKKKNKNISKKTASGLIWYCNAVSGIVKIGAKHTNKQVAQREALYSCNKKLGKSTGCRILNCFLIR